MNIEQALRDILYILITGCGMALVKYIVDLVNKKIDELQINTELSEYNKLHKYINDAQAAIEKAVISTTQVYVESLKASGGFTKEAQTIAKERSIEVAKQLITEESKQAIIKLYSDFDMYLDSTIETLVNQNK